MKIIIDYIESQKKSETQSFSCDIAPHVGDLARVRDTAGVFVDAKVVDRTFDFTEKEVSLRIGVSPVKKDR
jgi:hypothetical protein